MKSSLPLGIKVAGAALGLLLIAIAVWLIVGLTNVLRGQPPTAPAQPDRSIKVVTLYSGGLPVRTWTVPAGDVSWNGSNVSVTLPSGETVRIHGTHTVEPAGSWLTKPPG